jgi:hypothetical protein
LPGPNRIPDEWKRFNMTDLSKRGKLQRYIYRGITVLNTTYRSYVVLFAECWQYLLYRRYDNNNVDFVETEVPLAKYL